MKVMASMKLLIDTMSFPVMSYGTKDPVDVNVEQVTKTKVQRRTR
jgi:hypothetical protein